MIEACYILAPIKKASEIKERRAGCDSSLCSFIEEHSTRYTLRAGLTRMDLDIEKLLVGLFFVLPGYLGIQVYEWWLGARKRSGFDEVALSLAASLAGAAVLVWIPSTRPSMTYLWDPKLSERTLIGLGLQLAVTVSLGFVSALVARGILKGRLGSRSLYAHAWDSLWSTHAEEKRYVGVQTDHGYYFGILELVDTTGAGSAVVLRNPKIWDENTRSYYATKTDLSYIPGEKVIRVDLSVIAEGEASSERGEEDPASTTDEATRPEA